MKKRGLLLVLVLVFTIALSGCWAGEVHVDTEINADGSGTRSYILSVYDDTLQTDPITNLDGLGKDIKTYEAQQLSIHLNDALKGSLDAVAALEKELLPDGFYLTIDNSGYCCECDITTDEQVDNDGNGYPVYKIITAFAPTEPLARLAALLKALAEMEGE